MRSGISSAFEWLVAPGQNLPLRLLLLLLLLSLGLNWPYVGSGFIADEVVIISAMQQDPLPYSRWRGAWSGDPSDLSWFGNPWWAEPGAIGSFFRPLPSLAIEGSLRLFGHTAFPLHLLAVLLHGAIGWLLYGILRGLRTGRGLPLLAAAVYVVGEDHSMTIGFISFITDIFCVFLVGLSLLLHLAWLRRRRTLLLAGAMVALAAALGCKETAAAAPLALILTSLLFPRGTLREAPEPDFRSLGSRIASLWRDPLAWAPAGTVMGLYLVLYLALDLGGMDNLTYVNPLANPARYLANLVVHLPVMFLATLTPVPPGLGFLSPQAFVPMAWAGAAVFLIFLAVLGRRLREPLMIWALALYLIALLPQLGTEAGERLLYFPYLFAAVLIALLIQEIGPLARRLAPEVRTAPLRRRLAGWYLAVVALPVAALLSALFPPAYVAWARPGVQDPVTAAECVGPAARRVVILNMRDFFGLLMTPTLLRDRVGRPLEIHILSAHRTGASLERLGESSFILRVDRRGWLTNFLARAFRRHPELQPGRRYPGGLFEATLLELTADGGDVLAVRFDIHRPLDDPETVFLYWDGASFRTLELHLLAPGEPVTLVRL